MLKLVIASAILVILRNSWALSSIVLALLTTLWIRERRFRFGLVNLTVADRLSY